MLDARVRSRAVRREPTIAVWGHHHGGNLGDELVVATIVGAIRRRMPKTRIIGISMSPADTRRRHDVEVYPINPGTARARPTASTATDRAVQGRLLGVARRLPGARRLRRLLGAGRKLLREPPFLWRSFRMLRHVDLVVVAGSGQLLDEWQGPWLHPYTTFRWATLARFARVPMLYPSVGAGPIESRLGAFFIRKAVASAEYVSVRDGHSARVLESIGSTGPFAVCPDMGYGLGEEILRKAVSADLERAGEQVVGLNVMAHQDPRYWPRGDACRYEAFLGKMTEFTRWLLEKGYSVRLFSSQPRSDGNVADDLVRSLIRGGDVDLARLQSAMDEIEEVEDLIRVIGGCDLVVAGRYHSVLLPLLLGIPVLGLAYNPKTMELLSDVGRPERCLGIDSFGVDTLVSAFEGLRGDEVPGARQALRARVASHRAAVEQQFELILGPVHTVEQLDVDTEVGAL
jgi:polysaccharide pyruvyl transferase WcaK-like protein